LEGLKKITKNLNKDRRSLGRDPNPETPECRARRLSALSLIMIIPLPVQFKALLHGQKGCVFFSVGI